MERTNPFTETGSDSRQTASPAPAGAQADSAAVDAAWPNQVSQGSVLDSIAEDLRPLAVPIADLRPAPDNARRHADRDIAALKASLHRFGQQKAIVVKREYRGVRNAVLAGNGTVSAARRLGWTHLAVSWFDGSDEAAKAYAVADNATGELSEWDLTQLAADLDAGLELGAFFDPNDLQRLLGVDAPPPDFQPVNVDAQGRLDQIHPIICPACGHEFHR
jgi:hypothetical protein